VVALALSGGVAAHGAGRLSAGDEAGAEAGAEGLETGTGSPIAQATAQTVRSEPVPIDAHVHLHPEHELRTVLDSAAAHFEHALRSLSDTRPGRGALLLAEVDGVSRFDQLHDACRSGPAPEAHHWSVERTSEALSLVARAPGRLPLILARGRQIVTRENIEVLALISSVNVRDGLPLDDVLGRVRDDGGVPVLPWGFGKWWRRRGACVAARLRAEDPGALFLGDNGGRPRLGPEPSMFELGRQLGYRILPGSDPLPLPGHQHRAGSCGLVLDVEIAPDAPAQALREALFASPLTFSTFGRRRPLLAFARDQIAMQRRKRLRRGS
jgi:hypothetical protein